MWRRSVRTFEEWRNAARPLLTAAIEPAAIEWGDAHFGAVDSDSSAALPSDLLSHRRPPHISASLLRLLEALAVYRDPGRWELMYRLAWRSINENPGLLHDSADPDVRHAMLMERAVNRDVHKMHAFVRFRETIDEAGHEAYFAWFEPQHEILRRASVFFVKRFPNMDWTIATPDGAASWKASTLSFIASPDPASPDPASRPRAFAGRADAYEDLWRTYYRNICNVARINTAAMRREMPKYYWRHLPEAAEIDLLVREGSMNFVKNQRESSSEENVMSKAIQRALAMPAAEGEGPPTCRRCELWQHATQAVVGEGAASARIMLVGEQPGDEEDLRGHPFVGPAGKVLDLAIDASGLERGDLFITNAVKHFKWEPRGKRRLHKKPGTAEIKACNIWLEQEIAGVKPAVIVALGASALRALTGSTLSVDSARRQELAHPSGARIVATYHPSAILRAEGERIEELRGHLVADLSLAASLI